MHTLDIESYICTILMVTLHIVLANPLVLPVRFTPTVQMSRFFSWMQMFTNYTHTREHRWLRTECHSWSFPGWGTGGSRHSQRTRLASRPISFPSKLSFPAGTIHLTQKEFYVAENTHIKYHVPLLWATTWKWCKGTKQALMPDCLLYTTIELSPRGPCAPIRTGAQEQWLRVVVGSFGWYRGEA